MDTRFIDLKAGVWAGHDVDQARFFGLKSTEENITVKLSRDSHGSGSEVAEDVGAGFKEIAKTEAGRFGRVDFLSDIDQRIYYGVSERDVVDDTIFGEVTVTGVVSVDPVQSEEFPEFSATRGGDAVVGEYASVVFRNPTGSGKKIYVKLVGVDFEGGGEFLVSKFYETALVASVEPYNVFAHDSDSGGSVLLVGVSSGSEIYSTDYIGQLIGHARYSYRSDGDREYKMSRPVILRPGEEFVVYSRLPNMGVSAYIEYEERPELQNA